MSTFWQLMKESVITQATVTIVTVGSCCYLWITNQPVPNELLVITTTCLAFYFGSKTGLAQGKAQAQIGSQTEV